MARPALRIDVSARDQKALRKLVSGGGQASACGSPCVGPFAAAGAALQAHWCPALVLPPVGSVRLFAVSYKAILLMVVQSGMIRGLRPWRLDLERDAASA